MELIRSELSELSALELENLPYLTTRVKVFRINTDFRIFAGRQGCFSKSHKSVEKIFSGGVGLLSPKFADQKTLSTSHTRTYHCLLSESTEQQYSR